MTELRNAGILRAADGVKPSSQGKRIAFDDPGRMVIEDNVASRAYGSAFRRGRRVYRRSAPPARILRLGTALAFAIARIAPRHRKRRQPVLATLHP